MHLDGNGNLLWLSPTHKGSIRGGSTKTSRNATSTGRGLLKLKLMHIFRCASTWTKFYFIYAALLFIVELPYLSATFFHNIGMLQYQRFITSTTVKPVQPPSIANTLHQVIERNPNDASAMLRLAGLYTLLGQNELAAEYTRDGLTVLGKPRCYIEQQDFWRWMATPPAYIPDKLIDFDHPQSRWRFESIYLATGTIQFEPKRDSKHCVAKIIADHDLVANRFLWLWQETQVKPNQRYQFSAVVRATGLEQAWLGIKSQWAGTPIRNSPEWQAVSYTFRTLATQSSEAVQFVIEAGHGTLEIDNVVLELLEP